MITRTLRRRHGPPITHLLVRRTQPIAGVILSRLDATLAWTPAASRPQILALSDRRRLHTSPVSSGMLQFKLPDIGEGIAEVEMLKWHVEVGQKVDHFDDLCEVQSDKST